MRKPISYIFMFICTILTTQTIARQKTTYAEQYDFNCEEKKITIVIPSYNNERYFKKNLDSIKSQNYKNYEVIYINDNSNDKTGKLVETYIKDHTLEYQFILIHNKKNIGAMANIFKAVHMCDNDTIIAILDGDDWFAHNNVLKTINSVYQNQNMWLTYGQFKYSNGKKGFCRPIAKEIIINNSFRKKRVGLTHLRTFYAGLFKLIKTDDFLHKGKFYQASCDVATMYPMIEMAGERHKFISDILYIYNTTNPINDHKKNKYIQTSLAHEIRSKQIYNKITWQELTNAPTISWEDVKQFT